MTGGEARPNEAGKPAPARVHRADEPPAPDPELEAFFSESPTSLTAQYWGPIDSLVPVRMDDLTAPEEPPPPPRQRRLRGLDLIVGSAGVTALIVLAAFVAKSLAEPSSRPVHATAAPTAQPVAPERRILARRAPEARPAPIAPQVPADSLKAADGPGAPTTPSTASPMPSAEGASERPMMAAPETSPPPASASTAATEPAAGAPPAPRRRRSKMPKEHTPPTASFPD